MLKPATKMPNLFNHDHSIIGHSRSGYYMTMKPFEFGSKKSLNQTRNVFGFQTGWFNLNPKPLQFSERPSPLLRRPAVRRPASTCLWYVRVSDSKIRIRTGFSRCQISDRRLVLANTSHTQYVREVVERMHMFTRCFISLCFPRQARECFICFLAREKSAVFFDSRTYLA